MKGSQYFIVEAAEVILGTASIPGPDDAHGLLLRAVMQLGAAADRATGAFERLGELIESLDIPADDWDLEEE